MQAGNRYNAIGLMSGTSLDGVDAALIDTDGEQIYGFGVTAFRPYTREEQQILHEAVQAALSWNFVGAPPNIFAHAENIIDAAHIEAAQMVIQSSKEKVDLIGFHGQTVVHKAPHKNQKGSTLQLGSGHRLADVLGIDVIYDFRSADMEIGGQGAPLTPLYHQALLRKSNVPLPAAILNIGGVANISLLTVGGVLKASDCGPGNGPLDTWAQQCGVGTYDKDGHLSLAGTPNFDCIDTWLRADFFTSPVPKSADRWDFDVLGDISHLSVQNGAATLAAFTAMAIKNTLDQYDKVNSIIVCGGGRKNPAIMAALKEQKIGNIMTAEHLDWRGDDIEAEAFAFLAVRSKRGLPLSLPSTTGAAKSTLGGIYCKAN